MLNADFYRDYIHAQHAHGHRNPIVPGSSLATPLLRVTPDEFVAYSVIPITASGQFATTSEAVHWVAMPHVFRRPKEGCGQWIDLEKASEASLTIQGFAPKRGTSLVERPQAMEDARQEARRLLHRILAVYGLPNRGPVVAADQPSHGGAVPHVLRPSLPQATQPLVTRPSVSSHDEAVGGDDGFFSYLLAKVGDTFEQSDICAYQRRHGFEWWYAICALPLRREQELLLGLKWGVDPSAQHVPQTAPPTPEEVAQVANYRFIARSRPFLERHVGPLERFNYLNVCPFRAPKLTYLTDLDWQLAIDHFFLELIDYLRPPRTLIIGITDVNVLDRQGLIQHEAVSIRSEGKTETGYRGFIKGKTGRHPFGAVPQPTYAMTNTARDALWHEVFAG